MTLKAEVKVTIDWEAVLAAVEVLTRDPHPDHFAFYDVRKLEEAPARIRAALPPLSSTLRISLRDYSKAVPYGRESA